MEKAAEIERENAGKCGKYAEIVQSFLTARKIEEEKFGSRNTED